MSAQLQLFPSLVWDALVALLTTQLAGVDVDAVTDKDFDQQGQLILLPPSVRVLYDSTGFKAIETQRTSYDATHRFLVSCADEDRTSAANQARASLVLAQRAMDILAGARLRLSTNEITEPIALVSIETLPIASLGVAYAAAIEAPGPSTYTAPNAWPAAI